MRNYSRFIPGEEIDSVEQWRFGAVDSAALLLAAKGRVDEDAAEHAKDDALTQQGYAQGYEEGFVQGQAQLRIETQRDASLPGTEVVATTRYGMVEIRDVAGQTILI